jgi:chromosome segregation ATPase
MTAMRRLLHLSELLAAKAERQVTLRNAALAQAHAAVETERAKAVKLRAAVADQKSRMRDLFLGAAHARQAVELLLSELTGFDGAIAQAEEEIAAAITARDRAVEELAAAKQVLREAQNKVQRRAIIVTRQRVEAARKAELAAELAALEPWSSLQHPRTQRRAS